MNKKILIIGVLLASVIMIFLLEGFEIPEIDSIIGEKSPGDIEFELFLEESQDFNFSLKNISLSFTGEFKGELGTANITTNRFNGSGFSGSIEIEDDKIEMNGVMDNIDVGNSEISSEDIKISGNGTFQSVRLNGIVLNSLDLESVSGNLTASSAFLPFENEDVKIDNINGDLVLSTNFKLNGTISKLVVPDKEFSIG